MRAAARGAKTGLGVLVALGTLASSGAVAQQPQAAQQQAAAPSADELRRRALELDEARLRQQRAGEIQDKLKADIAAIGADRAELTGQLTATASRLRAAETAADAAEKRLDELVARETASRAALDARRSDIVEVLAALQRAGRRAPPALLVRPEDALASLRTAMLLGAVVPDMRARAESIVAALGDLVALRQAVGAERDRLTGERDTVKLEQTRLAALVDERQRQQSAAERDMQAEAARALALSKQVDNLQSLIARMEQDIAGAARAAAAAQAAEQARLDAAKPKTGPGRTSPAVAFALARGQFALPVNGTRLRGFGGSDGVGGILKGISLGTKSGAQVTTPCDGWVVYAGPFRSYGQLLILNAGGGYHVLIAGMERISVGIGQFVTAGEPVATMGTVSQVASVVAASASQPVLYVEFRKDGTPIDPSPWWAASEGEKVRG